MNTVCPICINPIKTKCNNCGFELPLFAFLSEDDTNKWYKGIIVLLREKSVSHNSQPFVKQCKYCGNEIQETWRFCPYCANKIATVETTSTQHESDNSKREVVEKLIVILKMHCYKKLFQIDPKREMIEKLVVILKLYYYKKLFFTVDDPKNKGSINK